MQYAAFGVWLLSLTKMELRLSRVPCETTTPSFSLLSLVLLGNRPQFGYPFSIKGQPGHFQSEVDKADVNVYEQLFVEM